MKTLFRLYLRKNDTIPADAFDANVQAFPAWHDADRAEFSCDLPFHDPRAAQILECLRSHGLKPNNGLKHATSHEFSVRLERTYDRKDFESAPAIQLNPVSRYHRLPPKESGGPLIVPTTEKKPKSRIMSGGYHQLLISDETKTAFETEDFAGIVFRPIELEGLARSVAKFQGTFWELDSTVVLPPMAPSMRFFTQVPAMKSKATHHRPSSIATGLIFRKFASRRRNCISRNWPGRPCPLSTSPGHAKNRWAITACLSFRPGFIG